MDGTITLARPAAADDRAHDVSQLGADRRAALAQARAWIARAAERHAAGDRARAARALYWAAAERDLAARYRRAAALRAAGMGLFEAMHAAGLHTGAGR
ncbi:hypothetical protein GCM10010964_43350 [Caldovatus sediminis]|uniref:Uncharacterized protein n=1 Tax=Caldovatus sediminis TaxID=2041189 RepID=A0A8J2ZFB9_9PROT|nr:hypothetical protein [Caldovatus sediminis]GGG51431.1 hypothetical protein GCM10010964_43350 [Caldovatus sediminis]